MNISAPFIKRPIGTSLLTLALLMSGVLAFTSLPVAPLAAGGISGDPGGGESAGRESGDHGFGGRDSAGAAIRPNCRHQSDDFDQPARLDRHRFAVRSEPQH